MPKTYFSITITALRDLIYGRLDLQVNISGSMLEIIFTGGVKNQNVRQLAQVLGDALNFFCL